MPKLKPIVVDGSALVMMKKAMEAGLQIDPNQVFRAFKYSESGGHSPHYDHKRPLLVCKRGAVLRVPKANTNPNEDCGAGVNVATRAWCVDDGKLFNSYTAMGRRLWVVEFRWKDIACLPKGTEKFRLYRCRVVAAVKKTRGAY